MTKLSGVTYLFDIHSDKVAPSHHEDITIAGWLRTRRSSKKFSFLEINDGTSPSSLQVIVNASCENYDKIIKLSTGAALTVQGKLIFSPAEGQKYELQSTRVEILGEADPETYPIQKKEMSLEYLREIAHMRVRTATFSSIFRIRSAVSLAIHRFFEREGFFYVHTPVLTTSDGEGAGEAFQVTNLCFNTLPLLPNGAVDYAQDFFAQQTLLCVTGQLEAEVLAMGLNKVYTFGPTFRAENSNTSRHLAEFWMVEPEFAFASLEENMNLAEAMLRFVIREVLQNCQKDLDICTQKASHDPRKFLHMVLEKPFVKVSYTEVIHILSTSAQQFEYPIFWGCDLKSEHERYICEQHFQSPTIVYDYPEQLKAFYMYLNSDQTTVRAMDVLVPGIGELIGGSQREHRLEFLKERMDKKGLDTAQMDWYVSLRRFGSVPHSGFGLGLERLLMWITGMGNIRDVIPFPRTPGNCLF
jgi:asparaginyl-tRNA synthetase